MVARTLIEHIIADHLVKPAEVEPGAIVWMGLDVRAARDFGGANVVSHLRREFPDGAPVADPGKTFFTFDCVVPANTIPYASNQHICRQFAREHGVRVFDVQRGIGSHVLMEEGLAVPGGTVVNTDSHMNIVGAVGCFGQGMGDADIAFGFHTGFTWFEVPPSVRIVLEGTLPPGCTGKDVALGLLRRFGAAGLLNHVVEFAGDGAAGLDLPARITVSSMATEMGLIAAFFPVDEVTRDFYSGLGVAVSAPTADLGARYAAEYRVNLAELEPLVATPPAPHCVVPLRELLGKPVDSVFLGSCTNGRFEDFAVAAGILKGREVAEGVVANLVPATRPVWSQLLESGLLEELFVAGVNVSNPGCGGCAAGQIGMTGKGEVQVSTSNRNFPGKQGAGLTHLASPLVAAAAAVTGRFTDPRTFLE